MNKLVRRIKWDPVLKAGKEDIQSGFKEYTRQAQVLSEMDYSDFLKTKEKVTIKAKVRNSAGIYRLNFDTTALFLVSISQVRVLRGTGGPY